MHVVAYLNPVLHFICGRKTYSESLEVPEGLSTGNVVGRGGCNVKKLYTITKSCHIKVHMGTVKGANYSVVLHFNIRKHRC